MTMRAMRERSRWYENGRKVNRQRGNGCGKQIGSAGMDVEIHRMLRGKAGELV